MKRRGPTIHTLIPPAAQPIIDRAHQRYYALHPEERPPLDDPRAVAALLTSAELRVLADSGYYPIPPAVVRLGCTPAERQARQLLDATLEIVANQIPEGLAAVLEAAE